MRIRYKSIDILKGIAMIMVILVHYEQSFSMSNYYLGYLQKGCSIFFVCSGFGIISLINKKYTNMELNKKELIDYYFSRFKALAAGWHLAFLFIFIVNSLMILKTGETLNFGFNRDVLSIVINLLFLNGLFPHSCNNVMPGGWYIGTLSILYFFTPFIFKYLNNSKNRKRFYIISSAFGIVLWGIFKLKISSFSYEGFSGFFFLVRYPEYILGMMLYYDLKENNLSNQQIKLCLPIGILMFLVAFILFNIDFPLNGTLSGWITALGTYLILYYMMTLEQQNMLSARYGGDLLASFGKNSYGIYLLHAFYAWSFISAIEKIFNNYDLSIKNPLGFVIMLPIVLALSYFTGVMFNKLTKKVTQLIFK